MGNEKRKEHRSKDRPLQMKEKKYGRDKPAATETRQRKRYFWVGLVRARNTRSSTGTVRVKMVGAAALVTPTA
jgi:hypothetical protein